MNNRIIDILTLELKSGCNDKAVNGGLNNFLANLAQSESPKSPIIRNYLYDWRFWTFALC